MGQLVGGRDADAVAGECGKHRHSLTSRCQWSRSAIRACVAIAGCGTAHALALWGIHGGLRDTARRGAAELLQYSGTFPSRPMETTASCQQDLIRCNLGCDGPGNEQRPRKLGYRQAAWGHALLGDGPTVTLHCTDCHCLAIGTGTAHCENSPKFRPRGAGRLKACNSVGLR